MPAGKASLGTLDEAALQDAPAGDREHDLGGEREPEIRVAALARFEERANLAQRLVAGFGGQVAPRVR